MYVNNYLGYAPLTKGTLQQKVTRKLSPLFHYSYLSMLAFAICPFLEHLIELLCTYC